MATWRVCTLIALAQLVPSASSADNGALVQSRVDLHHQEPTTEELVASCANQLPLEALPADLLKANAKKMADSVVAAFEDPDFVRKANIAVTNETLLWNAFKQVTAKRLEKLDSFKSNKSKTQEQVFDKLYGFWSRHGEDLARGLAAEAAVREELKGSVPDGYLRETHPTKAIGPRGVYFESFQALSQKVDDIVDARMQGIAPDSKLLCDRVGSMITDVSNAYYEFAMAVRVKEDPAVESAVKSFAPGAAPKLLQFLHATYAMKSEVSAVFQDIIHTVKDANSNLLTQRFECQPI